MDMKYKSKIVCWGCLLLMAACDNDMAGPQEAEDDEASLVTFHIGTSESEEVVYTRAMQDATETKINKLTVYDFIVRQRTDAGKVDTLFESAQYLEYAGESVSVPKAGQFVRTDAGATVCLSLHAKENTTHVFAFVANEKKTHFDTLMYQQELPIDSLRRALTTRKLKKGESCESLMGTQGAVMTGTTLPLTIPEELKDASKMTVKLFRIVARVDVQQEVEDAQNLRIIDISAKHCAPVGYLFGSGSNGEATAESPPKNSLPISLKRNFAVSTEDLAALKQGQTCGKVLYLYEYALTETPVPTLVLTYTLNGAPRTIDVEMVATDGTRIRIRRNRRYTLIVGGTATRMACSLKE